MNTTLTLWHQEHVNFARLLSLLDRQLELFHEGGNPQYDLMLDIMFYMTHYPDVLHHPREDLVFAIVVDRDPRMAAKVGELTEQHARLKGLGEKLVRELDNILDGSIASREAVEADARAYVANFRRHIRVEETEVLPLAAKLLHEQDWATITLWVHDIEDPLFGAAAPARYAALREQIAREARA